MRKIEFLLVKEGQSDGIKIRNARVEDARRIQVLYTEAYGSNYPVPIIYDRVKMLKAIQSDNFFWLVAEHKGRIIGSLMYEIDKNHRSAKAGGAVVSRGYRQHNLANTMLKVILETVAKDEKLVDMVYAATRTVSIVPQQLTDKLGFISLGIFPNAHKVFDNETHTLAAYYVDKVWKQRKSPPCLLSETKSFFDLAKQQIERTTGVNIGTAKVCGSFDFCDNSVVQQSEPLIQFETISAPNFVHDRFARHGNTGLFKNSYVPFHEPNLLLISLDGKTEVYLHHEPRDKYSVIMGGRTEIKDFSHILNSVAHALNRNNTSYIEILVDAYSPELQRQALKARFLPSAYFPAMRRVGSRRWDYIVFSRCFDMLDFNNVALIPGYVGFLKAYLKIWRELYVDSVFKKRKKI